MILFPAIDVLDGRAVRLLYGKKENVTDYGDPLDRAKLWLDNGAEYLHVVDLSGAFDGNSHINTTLEKIAALGIPVQSGGGLRTEQDVTDRLNAGATRVILGTLCYTNPELFAELTARYGEKIVAGIDAKDGMLSIKGWTEVSDLSAVDFGKKAKGMGIACAVFTDISKDGALTGANVEATQKMQEETGLNVIASGGIASMDDLLKIKAAGLYGAILGRSIYTGAINLSKAIRECK
ncbi:MAG: 1-(5-phosphoribosyl)-5-[(5-phosphoribosylamino)methylideneamino] imidazole-4-carboxamide isomerase [Clostridia bacterium]|nr:1-(5-phosphoribosyl)-5-[(5-phosphoribosylamino)methylideneamino] imidazole-4-carboxamide isomerase [Clostridia bacterium]